MDDDDIDTILEMLPGNLRRKVAAELNREMDGPTEVVPIPPPPPHKLPVIKRPPPPSREDARRWAESLPWKPPPTRAQKLLDRLRGKR